MVPYKVSIFNQDRLERDFTKDFFNALTLMKNGKSSGIDGLPCEFYKTMWSTMGDEFCALANKLFSIGSLIEFLNRGLIKLIPNNFGRKSIDGWYPIIFFWFVRKLWPKI